MRKPSRYSRQLQKGWSETELGDATPPPPPPARRNSVGGGASPIYIWVGGWYLVLVGSLCWFFFTASTQTVIYLCWNWLKRLMSFSGYVGASQKKSDFVPITAAERRSDSIFFKFLHADCWTGHYCVHVCFLLIMLYNYISNIKCCRIVKVRLWNFTHDGIDCFLHLPFLLLRYLDLLENHDVGPHIQNRLQEAAKMVEIPSPVLPAARPGAYNKRTMCEHNMILWGLTKHR